MVANGRQLCEWRRGPSRTGHLLPWPRTDRPAAPQPRLEVTKTMLHALVFMTNMTSTACSDWLERLFLQYRAQSTC